MNKKEEQYIIIVCDSITNSVFESQVITPIHKALQQYPHRRYHILSFERNPSIKIPTYPNVNITVYKQYPYVHRYALLPAIITTYFFLQRYNHYRIIARGPLAGYIALHSFTKHCKQIIIQARGLLAQEYAYTHQYASWPYRWLHRARYHLLKTIEHAVYSYKRQNLTIEVVTTALKEYLISTWDANPRQITIAINDIPQSVNSQDRLYYRSLIRQRLGISATSTVYCYNGSYKPWQCPEKTIELFIKRYAHTNDVFLIILTQDIRPFEQLISSTSLPKHKYHICTVNQTELYQYLSAADFGILLREKHIINYVARPCKALEYHAAGVTILHNQTVDYILSLPHQKQI